MRMLTSLALLVTLSACVTTQATLMNPAVTYAPICPDAVQIYSTPERVQAPYAEVAVINSAGAHDWTTEQQMLASMREKAAELGANGVILGEIKEPGGGAKVAGAIFGVSVDRKGNAIAIHVSSDTARVNDVCNVTRSFADKNGIQWTVREVVTNSKKRALRFTHENGVTSRHIMPPPDAWRTVDEDELRKLLSRSMNGPGR